MLKIANFFYPLLFRAFARNEPFRIYKKSFSDPKTSFLTQQTVKIWWS